MVSLGGSQDPIRVTIVIANRQHDVALPPHEPIAELIGQLQELTGDSSNRPENESLVFQRSTGEVLSREDSLAHADIHDGEVLHLRPANRLLPPGQNTAALSHTLQSRPATQRSPGPRLRRLLPTLRDATIAVTTIALVSACWTVFTHFGTPHTHPADAKPLLPVRTSIPPTRLSASLTPPPSPTAPASMALARAATATPRPTLTKKLPPPVYLPPGYPTPTHEWRLSDGSGTQAADAIEGQSAKLYGSNWQWTAGPDRKTVLTLSGTGSYLTMPIDLNAMPPAMALSVQFKTVVNGGILISTGHDVPASGNSGAMPVMYIGTDGRLYAQFWTNGPGVYGPVAPLVSLDPVDDGQWHTATLTSTSTEQTLYLDGEAVRSQTGTIYDFDPYTYVGAGYFNNDKWVDAPANAPSYFVGSLSEVLFYDHPLTPAQAS